MIIEFDRLILLVSSTLILAYVSNLFYAKTKIPDIIWLLAIGIFLGPVTSVFQKDLFISLSPLMSTIALSIILFDAGLNLDIRMLLESISKAASISVASILSAIVTLGVVMPRVMPEFTLLQGMLLGAMIGGTSTVAIFSVLSSLEMQLPNIETTKTILLMESVISDPICIISSITLIKMIMLPRVSIIASFMTIVFMFVYSSLFGVAVGLIWSGVLSILRNRKFNNMITLAVLLLIYIMAETVMGEGGGVMTALTFGLTIANSNWILSKIGLRRKLMVNVRQLKEFHDEITFFIKAFFFVYIGLIVTISRQYFAVGLSVFVLLQALRYGVLTSLSPSLSLTRRELSLSRVIYASGLPAFIMSQLPMLMDPGREHFASPEVYPNLTMPIVIFTLLFASLAGPYIVERQLRSPGVEPGDADSHVETN